MPIKLSGPLSMSEIVAEFGDTAPHALSEHYRGGVRVPNISVNNAIPTSGIIRYSHFYGAAVVPPVFVLNIASNQTNANLRTLAINAGWNQTQALSVTNSATIYATSTGIPGLTINGSFPSGVTLTNNGAIYGMGGNGGRGAGFNAGSLVSALAGAPGGPALQALSPITIVNNGTIAGGGGGGGGGAASGYSDGKGAYLGGAGGGGGGGRTIQNTAGGTGGTQSISVQAGAGGTGTGAAAGSGGSRGYYVYTLSDKSGSVTYYVYGGLGGAGGDFGAPGGSGSNFTQTSGASAVQLVNPAAGGAAGAAVQGNGNITWVATGVRLGAIT